MDSHSPARPPLLIFDGDCAFCTTSVGWLGRILPAMPAAAPYQWTDLAAFALTPLETVKVVRNDLTDSDLLLISKPAPIDSNGHAGKRARPMDKNARPGLLERVQQFFAGF